MAQYRGGIIVNPGFDHNINGWKVFGNGTIEERVSNNGNRFIVASKRTQPLDSFSQKVQLKKGMIYTFSGNLCFSFVIIIHCMFTMHVIVSLIDFSKTFSTFSLVSVE